MKRMCDVPNIFSRELTCWISYYQQYFRTDTGPLRRKPIPTLKAGNAFTSSLTLQIPKRVNNRLPPGKSLARLTPIQIVKKDIVFKFVLSQNSRNVKLQFPNRHLQNTRDLNSLKAHCSGRRHLHNSLWPIKSPTAFSQPRPWPICRIDNAFTDFIADLF